jgi:predicted transcriptional regulator
MTLREMKEILDAEVVVGHDQLDMNIREAGCADSMADVLFFGKAGMVLLTGLTNPHIVHTAQTLGIAALIIVRGKQLPAETIQLAEKLKVPVLLTDYLLYETVGRLYTRGLMGVMKKVGERSELL